MRWACTKFRYACVGGGSNLHKSPHRLPRSLIANPQRFREGSMSATGPVIPAGITSTDPPRASATNRPSAASHREVDGTPRSSATVVQQSQSLIVFVAGLPVLPFFFGVIATTHFPFDASLILQDALRFLTVQEPRIIFDVFVVLVARIV